MPNWTIEQQKAIEITGSNIIVSAGAGSGKTAVLSERVLQKVLKGIDINRLLILTFTNLAAAEMKERIRKKIKGNKDLVEQLNKLDASYITTFDSYALSIVKKYHYLLGISRNINIIDKNLLDMEIDKIIDNIFEDKYRDNDINFIKLISDFCIKDDKNIKKEIIKLNDKLNMLYDKEKYFDKYFDVYYSDDFINKKIEAYIELIKLKIFNINNLINSLYDYCDSDYVNSFISDFNPLLKANNYTDFLIINNIKFPNLPRGSSDEAKTIKEKITDLKNEIIELVRFNSIDEIKESILSTKPYVIAIIDIIKKLDQELIDYKNKNDAYEFIDISKMAIKIVKENSSIADEIRYSFDEILVDEYQDTSDLQEEFINCIANKNVYMVGDIKQSIYRFRNANPNIFKNKYDNYAKGLGGIKIDLLKNFRSREEVLNNINLLFQYILDDYIGGADYKASHAMIYGNTSYIEEGKTDQNYNFELHTYNYDKESSYNKNEIEAFIIARDILNKVNSHYQIFDKDKKELRDINYGDFSILIDRSTSFDLYKKILLFHQIPVNILRDEYLNETDDLLVIKNIFKILNLVKNKDYGKEFIYCFLSIGRSFLMNYSDDELFTFIKNKNFDECDIIKKIKIILDDIESLSISLILDKIIEVFNYYDNLLKVGDINESLTHIDYLYNLANNLSELGYNYNDFASYIDDIFKEERQIRYSINNNQVGSVNIMSIHKSKGLEYHICYFPALYPKFNEDDLKEKFIYDNTLGIITPYFKEGIGNTIYKDLYKNNYLREEIGERIRLFYVALTRAKEKMILIMPNEEMNEEYQNDIVSNDIRLSYNSFFSIIKSIKSKLKDYIKEIDLNSLSLSKDYNLIKNNNIFDNINDINEKIDIINYPVYDIKEIDEAHFSKSENKLIDLDTKDKMEFGTYMHYLLEVLDFNNPNLDIIDVDSKYKEKIKLFLNSDLLKNINSGQIYKEYEFIYNENNISKHGIIDLMIEYPNYIDIIDYKLKNIDDEHYLNQLKGYRDYINSLTNKEVNIYLYSIIEGNYKKI